LFGLFITCAVIKVTWHGAYIHDVSHIGLNF
jgi:hypothetical protein